MEKEIFEFILRIIDKIENHQERKKVTDEYILILSKSMKEVKVDMEQIWEEIEAIGKTKIQF